MYVPYGLKMALVISMNFQVIFREAHPVKFGSDRQKKNEKQNGQAIASFVN